LRASFDSFVVTDKQKSHGILLVVACVAIYNVSNNLNRSAHGRRYGDHAALYRYYAASRNITSIGPKTE
jgi:hypothetical protein